MKTNTEDTSNKPGRIATAKRSTVESFNTALILLYIFNGVASFLLLFGLVEASQTFSRIVGSIAFAFSIFALVAFTNLGVKHQSSNKKGRK